VAPTRDRVAVTVGVGTAARDRVAVMVGVGIAARDRVAVMVGVRIAPARDRVAVAVTVVVPIGACPPIGLMITNRVNNEVNNLILYIHGKIPLNRVYVFGSKHVEYVFVVIVPQLLEYTQYIS